MDVFECAIVGAGAAGLSAGLILGRSRRRVVLFDNGTNRNRVTQEAHGFLTRDGIQPAAFRQLALEEVSRYPTVHYLHATVMKIEKQTADSSFRITVSGDREYLAEKIILATGIREQLPRVPDIDAYYGKSLFSCPYCDGWELRDQPLILIAENEEAAYHGAKLIFHWSEDLLVATNGRALSESVRDELERKGMNVITEPIKKLDGDVGYLKKVIFLSGFEMERKGGFIATSFYRPNRFAEQLGCEIQNGQIVTDAFGRTSQKHVYAAGEYAHLASSSLMIAAAEGNKTAAAVNGDLIDEAHDANSLTNRSGRV